MSHLIEDFEARFEGLLVAKTISVGNISPSLIGLHRELRCKAETEKYYYQSISSLHNYRICLA